MFSLGEYERIVVRWSLVVQYMSVSSIIYSVLHGEYEGIVVKWDCKLKPLESMFYFEGIEELHSSDITVTLFYNI